MTVTAIFWTTMAVLVIVVLPIFMVASAWQHFNSKSRSGQRQSTGAGIGSALEELDRLVARPAAEYTVEAQTPLVKRADNESGD